MSAAALAAAPAVLVSNADAQTLATTVTTDAHAPLIQGPMSGSQAREASTGGVVIYFGDGIRSVDANVQVLRRHGVPTLGITGAPPGTVLLLVDGRYGGRFTQSDLDRASLIDSAVQQFSVREPEPR